MWGENLSHKVIESRLLAVSQARKILESIGEENLDQFQRRTLEYTRKFSKIDAEAAEEIIKRLVEKYELSEEEAVEIVNCMPKSIDELRTFLAGGRRIVEVSKLKSIIDFLNKYR